MEDIRILLYLDEEAYGQRFLRFLSGKKDPRIHPELVTEKDMLLRRVGISSQRIVVLTDDESVYEDGKREVILLAGEQDGPKKKIFQYQRAEKIYEQLLALLHMEKAVSREDAAKEGVIMLFSPDGGDRTETAVLLSQYLGKQGKCLYISLSGFPVYYGSEYEKEPSFLTPGLGELLLCPGQEFLADKLSHFVQPFGSADMLAPLPHYKDLLDCSIEDWRHLLDWLRNEGGYDSVVVEVGQLFETLLDLLELGDRILIFNGKDAIGKVRGKVFCHYCQMEQRNSLLERAEFIPIPEEAEEWRQSLSMQTLSEWASNNRIMGQMKDLLEGRREEEDVCMWEDLG